MSSDSSSAQQVSAYTTNVDDYLVIWINGDTRSYIAQVVQSEPLRLKVADVGPYACLKESGDYIIRGVQSARLQKDDRDNTCEVLREYAEKKSPLISALRSLGADGETLVQILPAD